VAFDVSGVITPSSWEAALLKGVLNFSPQTTWLQAGVWVAFVAVVMTLFVRQIRRSSRPAAVAA
jgi:high-affinity iron transporter